MNLNEITMIAYRASKLGLKGYIVDEVVLPTSGSDDPDPQFIFHKATYDTSATEGE